MALKHQKEPVQLLNMVMLQRADGQVLVLDKVIKHGWEGLTFPGGKVEPGESLDEAMRREAWEETGLTLGKIELCGFVHWIHDSGLHQVGMLYRCEDFTGEVKESEEGTLRWWSWEAFRAQQPKSQSMDEILEIYAGNAREVLIDIHNDEKGNVRFTK